MFLTVVHIVKVMGFPVVMYRYESWTIEKVEHWIINAFELWCWKRLESPLDCKEIKPVKPKGDQFWMFIGSTDAETEAPILWSPDAKSQLIGKDLDAGKDWRQKEKGITEDEMIGWHHQLNGLEFEQTSEDSDREAWHAAVHGVAKSWTQPSDWTTITTTTSPCDSWEMDRPLWSQIFMYNFHIDRIVFRLLARSEGRLDDLFFKF